MTGSAAAIAQKNAGSHAAQRNFDMLSPARDVATKPPRNYRQSHGSRTSSTASRDKKNGRSWELRPIALEELPVAYAFFSDIAYSLT
jgi:hypothetical protein